MVPRPTDVVATKFETFGDATGDVSQCFHDQLERFKLPPAYIVELMPTCSPPRSRPPSSAREPPQESSNAQRRTVLLNARTEEEAKGHELSRLVPFGQRLISLPEDIPNVKLLLDGPAYGDESVCAVFRSRVGWLGLFLIGLWSAAFIIAAFEHILQARPTA